MRSRRRGGCPRRPRRPRRLQRATGGGAVRPPRARPGPPGRTPHPAPAPGCSRGPVPARWPGRTALPSSRPRRAPQPPAAAPTPRWALRAPAPAPRRPGAVSDPPPANAALNLRNNKQPDMSESAAAGPPSLAAKPQARPDRGGNGRRQDNLFRGPRAPRAHPRDTHTTRPAPPPRAAPARGTHSSRGPGEDHTRNIPGHAASLHEHTHIRSRHAPTHAFPAHSAFTGTHAAPGGVLPRHTYTSRTPRADTLVPDPFPRLHTRTRISQAHTSHTRPLLPTRAESTEHSSPHAEQKNTSHSRTHNKQHSRLGHTQMPKNATHQQRQLLPHNRTQMDTQQTYNPTWPHTHTTQRQTRHSAHTPCLYAHNIHPNILVDTQHTQHLFLHIPQTHSQAHHPLSTRSHIQHSRHTGSKLATSGHPTLPLSFEIRHRRRGSAGQTGSDRRALTCRSLGLGCAELEGERQDESLGAGHGAPPPAPGPGAGGRRRRSPSRARGEPEPERSGAAPSGTGAESRAGAQASGALTSGSAARSSVSRRPLLAAARSPAQSGRPRP